MRSIITRLTMVLALIVQIWAPVGSSRMVLTAAFSPLGDVYVCEHAEGSAVDRSDVGQGGDRALAHCDLCQLATNVGWTPPLPAVAELVDVVTTSHVAWSIDVEAVVDARFLARIRGRAPPSLA